VNFSGEEVMKASISLSRIAVLATALLVNQAYAAAALTPTDPVTGLWTGDQPLGYIGPIELSNSDLSGGVKAYRGWFENGGWQGDLIEYDVSSGGGLSTSIDLTGTKPVQSAGGTNWSAYLQFDAADDDPNYWDTGRKIITSNGTNWPHQTAFRWTDAAVTDAWSATVLTDVQKAQIGSKGIYEFIRGNRALENPAGTYRSRFNLMGDVIHSKPHYVGVPDFERIESSYTDFVNANLTRAPRVYVGANDGMMHAFDALTGDEVWAYVPSMLFPNLSKLASRPFSHTYFVDGGTTVGDVQFYSDGIWHTILVGGLGGGGKGLYALDVTSPDISNEFSRAGYDDKVHWENTPWRTQSGEVWGDRVGYIMGAPVIAKTNHPDKPWWVFTGNGVSSVNGVAMLMVIDVEVGWPIWLSTGSGGDNGLSAPAVVDVDNNGTADIVYAGDLNGDLWRFDVSSDDPADWEAATSITKLYDGDPSQPITTAPDVSTHPVYGHLVMFGTGQLYTLDDKKNTSTQALIGIWDKGTGTVPTTDNKLAQLFSDDTDYADAGYIETVRTITTPTTTTIDWSTHTGWITALKPGERVITPVQLRAGRLKATVHNPLDSTNWLVEVNFSDGGYSDQSIFDLNRDSILDEVDRVDNNFDTFFDSQLDIPMAWKRRNGNLSRVTIARIAKGVDTMFLNFLNPVLVPPSCTGTCTGGLSGGHMDVDTDKAQGGTTDVHVHEYDDKTSLTYVDYFNPQEGLNPVTSAGIETDEFIILVANADFSPGATLTIGNWQINVVEYQRLLHKALASYNGTAGKLTYDGHRFNQTLASLQAGTPAGTLRTTFDSLSIISGGLHPSVTGCVRGSDHAAKGRHRNGALTIQLVKFDHFKTGPYTGTANALDELTVQNPPDDFRKTVVVGGKIINLAEDLSDPLDGDSDDAGAPLYEIYGGMVAKLGGGFFYESTVFWHYDGSCYGTTTWEQDVQDARGTITEVLFLEKVAAAGFTTVDADGNTIADVAALFQAFNALEAQGCDLTTDKDGGCKTEYEALLELIDLSKRIVDENGDPIITTDTGTGLEGAGTTPVVIEGAITNTGVTSGPNFTTGRRTWIEILPAE
jgi:hypothetical protein